MLFRRPNLELVCYTAHIVFNMPDVKAKLQCVSARSKFEAKFLTMVNLPRVISLSPLSIIPNLTVKDIRVIPYYGLDHAGCPMEMSLNLDSSFHNEMAGAIIEFFKIESGKLKPGK
jgi:hypothetical protein